MSQWDVKQSVVIMLSKLVGNIVNKHDLIRTDLTLLSIHIWRRVRIPNKTNIEDLETTCFI